MTSFFEKVNNLARGAYYNLPETDFLQAQYIRVTTLLDALMNVQYQPSIPKWKHRSRVLHIANEHYDHLNQTLRVSSMPTLQLPTPALRSMRENWEALKEGYPGIVIGPRPKDIFLTIREDCNDRTPNDNLRTLCDVCYIVSHFITDGFKYLPFWQHRFVKNDLVHGRKMPCDRMPCKSITHEGIETCERCMMLKRPCTWTKHSNLIQKGWQSLGFLPECSYPIMSIPDPRPVSYISEPVVADVETEGDSE